MVTARRCMAWRRVIVSKISFSFHRGGILQGLRDGLHSPISCGKHAHTPGIDCVPIDDAHARIARFRIVADDGRVGDTEPQLGNGLDGFASSDGYGTVQFSLRHNLVLSVEKTAAMHARTAAWGISREKRQVVQPYRARMAMGLKRSPVRRESSATSRATRGEAVKSFQS